MSRKIAPSIILAALGTLVLATVATAAPPDASARGGTGPDLSVSGKASKASGPQLKYEVTLTATGPTTNDATVEIDPPAGVRVDSSQVAAGSCNGVDPVLCVIPPFGSGGTVGITLRFTPGSPRPVRLTTSLTAEPTDNADTSNDVITVVVTRRQICDNRATGGDDDIYGTRKGDILCGLGGADSLWGGPGNDLMFGGPGRDYVLYTAAPNTTIDLRKQGINVVGAAPTASAVTGHGLDSFTGIEQAVGGSRHDTIVGNDKTNRLFGEKGNDVLLGFGGRDLLFGGAGRDDLIGGPGSDYLDGGRGTDTCEDKNDGQVNCER